MSPRTSKSQNSPSCKKNCTLKIGCFGEEYEKYQLDRPTLSVENIKRRY